jgi:hypothetical protein
LILWGSLPKLRADGIGAPASATSQTPVLVLALKHKCRKMLSCIHARTK